MMDEHAIAAAANHEPALFWAGLPGGAGLRTVWRMPAHYSCITVCQEVSTVLVITHRCLPPHYYMIYQLSLLGTTTHDIQLCQQASCTSSHCYTQQNASDHLYGLCIQFSHTQSLAHSRLVLCHSNSKWSISSTLGSNPLREAKLIIHQAYQRM